MHENLDYKNKKTYSFWHKEHVRFNDIDVLGHVSSVKYHEYFASARTKLFHSAILDWPHTNIVPVLKTASIQYEAELLFPNELDVGLIITRFGHSSFDLRLAIFANDKCMALGENTFVCFDKTHKKSVQMPGDIKNKFIELTKFET